MDYIKEYSERLKRQELFTQKLENLVISLLQLNDTKHHLIDSRTKSVDSFKNKIEGKANKYSNPLDEVTDLTGIRIILYYQDEIDPIRQLIEREFRIDMNNSHFPQHDENPNVFGYQSTHMIVQLNDTRASLPEWLQFKTYKAEIQIRTVLQHSWSAISHALQYKSEYNVPTALQRQLARIAGLFELADNEFVDLKRKHSEMKIIVSNKDKTELSQTQIDIFSIEKFIEESELVKRVFQIALKVGFTKHLTDDLSDLLKVCDGLSIKRIATIEEIISKNMDVAEDLLKRVFTTPKKFTKRSEWLSDETFPVSILILYNYSLLIDIDFLINSGWQKEIAEHVLKVIDELKATNRD